MSVFEGTRTDERSVGSNNRASRRPGRGTALVLLIVTAALLLLENVRARADCPYGNCTSPIHVAVETTASPPGVPPCNSSYGMPMNFGSLPKNTTQSITLRACICPTDALASVPGFPAGGNLVDNSGIQFLNVNLSNAADFKISDSGCVRNGVPSQQPNNTGPNGAFFSTPFSGCPGNPTNYCYADITFQPKNYGSTSSPLQANLSFGVNCPGVVSNTYDPTKCFVYGSNQVLNYVSDGIKLQGIGSGFGLTLPANGTSISLSAPTSISDPGTASVTYQATAGSGTTVHWYTTIRYAPTGKRSIFNVPQPAFTTTASGNKSKTYSGQGGFVNVKALADSADDCSSVPVFGWSTSGPNDPLNCTISTLLRNEYFFAPSGSTNPKLLERLAFSESTYNQFAIKNVEEPPFVFKLSPSGQKCQLGLVSGLFPNENYPSGNVKRGDFIGLLQVPNSENTAWNWIDNIIIGSGMLRAKLKTAKRYSANRIKDDPGLALLNAEQLERTALGLYKGFVYGKAAGTRKGLVDWYYVPSCSSQPALPKGACPSPGSWSWISNPTPCTDGTNTCQPQFSVLQQVDIAWNSQAYCEQ